MTHANRSNTQPGQLPTVGVSACLLGHQVRFDGGHKRQGFIADTLAGHFALRPVCPETEIGLGVPRPAIHLRREHGSETVRLLNSRNHEEDLTARMTGYARARAENLHGLSGFIFKKDSPSCGMERVPVVVNADGYRVRDGIGLFAQAFIERWPHVPTEEEGRLNDPVLREKFFERVYAHHRWQSVVEPSKRVKDFIDFHRRHKLLLMARGASYYQELGRIVAGTTSTDLAERKARYIDRFAEVMNRTPTRGRQVNVMQHVLGYFKTRLDGADKQELLSLFEMYRRREVPLVTPLALLRHYLRRFPDSYLADQHWLSPFPDALALRSHDA